jgi:DNA-binding response OmpR family regulator
MASTSVLIVDDDPRRAESVSKRSRSDRWDVAIAGDVRTAREAIGNMANWWSSSRRSTRRSR